MPTPPFAVVHINKAFCTMTGLSAAQVIGSPVEKVIQVVQEIPKVSMSDLQDADTRADLRGQFLLRPAGTKDHLPMCEVHVAPITDRSQESRGMSHVLVKIKPVEPTDEDIDDHTTGSVSTQQSSRSSNETKDDLSPPAPTAKVFPSAERATASPKNYLELLDLNAIMPRVSVPVLTVSPRKILSLTLGTLATSMIT